MPPGRRRAPRVRSGVAVVCLLILSGCQRTELALPVPLTSPYEEERVWAVAPFANESGTSAVDTLRVADLFAQEVEQVNGLHAVSVNRVVSAMRRLGINAVTGPEQADALLEILEVDGLVVGTVTEWNPYPPLTFGAAVALFTDPVTNASIDPRTLTRNPRGEIAPGAWASGQPAGQASGIFDAGNHATLQQLGVYATGRSVPDSAYGPGIYLASMEMYTKFAGHRLIRDLLRQERRRRSQLAQMEAAP
jgi:hypothetical protein